MSKNAHAAWESILRVHALVLPRLEKTVFSSTGMSLTWYDVLLELNSAGGRLTMSQLGDRVVLSRSRVSRVVDELVGAALVKRQANSDDRRSSFAVLTTKGRERFLAAVKVYLPAIDSELGGVDEATLIQVTHALNKLLETADEG